ncbi:MAG: riboflavin biosynthesis protein RibF [Clostridiales bacterium]|jgi:riboflavin kinase/FMN adenylyltransferase|nr:riboflavin biosynthesis protein RibF [Clostridiales bacterium]
MKYIHGENIEIDHDLAITIGKFDGLHKGHIALIAKLKEVAAVQGFASALLSFAPHPAAVLSGKDVPLILSPHEKFHLLSQLKLDYYIEYPFTHQFAQIGPEYFIQNIVFQQLRGRALIIGENFRFGRGGLGDVALAKGLGADLGLYMHTLPLVTDDSVQVSAEGIRRLIADKDFRGVRQACGRDFFLMGDVVHGKKKGREMGFPTANIIPPESKLLPPVGVYHTTTFMENIGYNSITNVNEGISETHLLDFRGDLYGRTIRIDFLRWMRDMRGFASYEELSRQLEKDAAARLTLRYL